MYKLEDNWDKASDFLDYSKWRCYLGRTSTDENCTACKDLGLIGYDWYLTQTNQQKNLPGGVWLEDPTAGFVWYDQACETLDQFIVDQENSVVIKSKVKPGSGNYRDVNKHLSSPRIESVKTYPNGGVFVIDVKQVPNGCGIWPAFWMVGGPESWSTDSPKYNFDWPNYGEIDILEQVNGENVNHVTLHTRPGCNTGTLNCNAGQPLAGTEGCSILMKEGTGGAGIDGVYACEWTPTESIKTWFFKRDEVPSDLSTNSVDPSNWRDPDTVHDLSNGCSDSNIFQNLHLVLNTTFCGQWAGSNATGACAGNEFTDNSSCRDHFEDMIKDKDANSDMPENFFWKIKSIKTYTKDGSADSGKIPWTFIIAAVVLLLVFLLLWALLGRRRAPVVQT